MGAWERIRQRAAELGCSPAELAALALLAAGALAALGLLWLIGRPGPALGGGAPSAVAPPGADGAVAPAAAASEGGLAITAEPVVVHVAGRVAAPGLHRLPGGARVADALEAAGGPLPDAVLDALNLARPLSDGEQLLVPGPPAPGATPAPGAAGSGAGPAPAAGGAQRPDGTLDLNRASATELEELPGVGEVLAERIVTHRDANGPFTAVGDLREVPGIGEKILAGLAPLVGV